MYNYHIDPNMEQLQDSGRNGLPEQEALMIVHTRLLPPSLPSPSQVDLFTGKEERPIFYDIETTGLSKNDAFVYLIGAAVPKGEGWELTQWMAENEGEEADLLKAFSHTLSHCTLGVQYNGDSFDVPFLKARYESHALPSPFSSLSSLDLYKAFKPLNALFELKNMKQPGLEALLSCQKRQYPDGKACIRLYQCRGQQEGDPATAVLFGHNREDLLGLLQIFSMTAYLELFQGNWQIREARAEGEALLLSLLMPLPFPIPFSWESPILSVSGEGSQAALRMPLKEGRLRRYYLNCRDYVYLPLEDTAIPRALAAYMDKSLYQKARPDTCFTWFPLQQSFLTDREALSSCLKAALSAFLSTRA